MIVSYSMSVCSTKVGEWMGVTFSNSVPMHTLSSRRVRFGAFELDLTTANCDRLRRQIPYHKVLLREQVFQVLRMLLEREGKIVTREEIKGRLWPNDTVVDFDPSINATIKALRRALGDSADNPRYIETLATSWLSIDGRDRVPGVSAGNRTRRGHRGGAPPSKLAYWEEGFALPRTRCHRGRWHGSGFQSGGSQTGSAGSVEVFARRVRRVMRSPSSVLSVKPKPPRH